VQLLNSSTLQPLFFPAVSVDPASRRITANFNLPQIASSVSALYLMVSMEWTGYPQCALYNAVLLPSLPWEAVLVEDMRAVEDGGREGQR
jgi:hypothetical protein